MRIILFLILILLLPVSVSATTYTYYALNDTKISCGSPTTNYGNDALLEYLDADCRFALIDFAFNLTNNTEFGRSNKQIDSATLYFNKQSNDPGTVYALNILSSWNNGVVWNTQPSLGTNIKGSVGISAYQTGWIGMDVSNSVKEWVGYHHEGQWSKINPNGIYLKTNGMQWDMRTKEGGYTPYLVVTFTDAPYYYNLTLNSNSYIMTNFKEKYDYITLTNGASIILQGNQGYGVQINTKAYELLVNYDFNMDINSGIEGTGKGFPGGKLGYKYIQLGSDVANGGQGKGGGNKGTYPYAGGGGGAGSYIGRGGYTSGTGYPGASGISYGTKYGMDFEPGSGGGGGGGPYYAQHAFGTYGGAGGGGLRLVVNGTTNIHGTVLMNGQDGGAPGEGAQGGGGASGGAFVVVANGNLNVSHGIFRANGGQTGGSSGGGGGGKIAFFYRGTYVSTAVITSESGGYGTQYGVDGEFSATNISKWNSADGDGNGALILDGASDILALDGVINFTSITVINGATLKLPPRLNIRYNGSHQTYISNPEYYEYNKQWDNGYPLTLNVTGTVYVDSTSKIIVDSSGYAGGEWGGGYGGSGLGAGYNGGYTFGGCCWYSNYGGGAASFGGLGIQGSSSNHIGQRGSTYGTFNGTDVDMGSGAGGAGYSDYGKDSAGDNGGGLIKIIANNITIRGTISSNGGNGGSDGVGNWQEGHGGGGGSGGMIWLQAPIIDVSGSTLQVNGGLRGGDEDTFNELTGGCGRIKIWGTTISNTSVTTTCANITSYRMLSDLYNLTFVPPPPFINTPTVGIDMTSTGLTYTWAHNTNGGGQKNDQFYVKIDNTWYNSTYSGSSGSTFLTKNHFDVGYLTVIAHNNTNDTTSEPASTWLQYFNYSGIPIPTMSMPYIEGNFIKGVYNNSVYGTAIWASPNFVWGTYKGAGQDAQHEVCVYEGNSIFKCNLRQGIYDFNFTFSDIYNYALGNRTYNSPTLHVDTSEIHPNATQLSSLSQEDREIVTKNNFLDILFWMAIILILIFGASLFHKDDTYRGK